MSTSSWRCNHCGLLNSFSTKKCIACFQPSFIKKSPSIVRSKQEKSNENYAAPSKYSSNNKRDTTWYCKQIWDFDKNGGLYSMDQLNKALTYFNEYGFCVIKDAIDEKENIEARKLLLTDIKEINSNKKNVNIKSLSDITNDEMPGGYTANGLRLQFGISHGRFANFSRLRPNIKKIFAHFHECKESELNCSTSSIAVTPNDTDHRKVLWLHADQSMYDNNNKKVKGWNYLSIQGALYYTSTNSNTISFVCSPKSHRDHIWKKIAMKSRFRTIHWLSIDPISKTFRNDKEIQRIKQKIVNDAYRIHVPKNALLLWNSRTFHQNCDRLKDGDTGDCMKRIASLICMAPNKYREYSAFKNSLIYSINGKTSTHWTQFMIQNGTKYPRMSKGTCYENMKAIKPALNPEITEEQFQRMIPDQLRYKKVKIYNCNKLKDLTLETVDHLSIGDLRKFTTSNLWRLVHPSVKQLQPWMRPK